MANVELTPQLAYDLGRAGAYVLKKHSQHRSMKTKVIIGTDTRLSKDLLMMSLAAGAMSIGADVIDIGVVPTPAVAYLTRIHRADAGVVISASHNPMEYNGIKFFNSKGLKLDDSIESEIEGFLDDMQKIPNVVSHEELGKILRLDDYVDEYISFLTKFQNVDLTGLNITLDCANGAAYKIAPQVFNALGAKTFVINNEPDGININLNAGSTHLGPLSQAVLKNHSDVGLAYDGDADRLLAIDEKGDPVDGDRLMLIFAKYLKTINALRDNKLVVTVMSNLGLHIAAKELGIGVEVTAVGDRYILEKMIEKDYSIGGEQSGHMIFLDHNTTGDGILSSLILAKILKESGKKLSELAEIMDIYPQVLINAEVKNEKKLEYKTNALIQAEIKKLEEKMSGKGRVLIRHSGTEPLVRVMLEGQDLEEITIYARELSDLIERVLG